MCYPCRRPARRSSSSGCETEGEVCRRRRRFCRGARRGSDKGSAVNAPSSQPTFQVGAGLSTDRPARSRRPTVFRTPTLRPGRGGGQRRTGHSVSGHMSVRMPESQPWASVKVAGVGSRHTAINILDQVYFGLTSSALCCTAQVRKMVRRSEGAWRTSIG
jgi:hypothetical protein